MYGNGMYPPYYGGVSNFGRGLTGMGFGMPRNISLFQRLGRRGFNLSSILTNTQKTLGVVNQAIPVVKQVGPMINNMKTMFKLAGAFKDETDDSDSKKEQPVVNNSINNSYSNSRNTNNYNYNSNNGPEFFI